MTDYIANIGNNKIGGLIAEGPWVETEAIVIYGGSPSASFLNTYSLESYLPDDGCVYLVQFSGIIRTGATSNNAARMELCSGTGNDHDTQVYGYMSGVRTRTASWRYKAGSLILPIFPNDRNVTYYNRGSGTSGSTVLWMFRYRRMGTNV